MLNQHSAQEKLVLATAIYRCIDVSILLLTDYMVTIDRYALLVAILYI